MSTRATVNFCYGKFIAAKIYRHMDGHPEDLGVDLGRFFQAVKEGTKDCRFDDPSYLSAKFIVWQAGEYTKKCDWHDERNKLDFLSLGVCLDDPGDIEYTYRVDCEKFDEQGFPVITCAEIGSNGKPKKFVPLPKNPEVVKV